MSFVQQYLEKTINSISSLSYSSISFLLPFIFFIYFFYQWLHTKTSKIQNLPPSPPKIPLFGHLLQLGVHPHRTLQSLAERYGELMMLYLGNKPTLIVSSAKVVKEVMKTHDAIFSNRVKFLINEKLLYNCRDVAACPYGEYWRQMKSIFMLQLLSNRRVRSFKGIRAEETSLMMENIKQKCSSAVNLSEIFAVLTNDVICRVAFGKKYSENQLNGVDCKGIITEFVELIGVFNLGDFMPWLCWVNKFNGLDARLDRVAKSFDLVLEEILTEHSNRLNQVGINGDGENEYEAKDFVDVLLQVQKDNSAGFALDRDSLKGLIMDVFAAGTDTTYTVLEWAMTEALRNPNIMKELQKEISDIGGDKEYITEEDLEKMKYLKAVTKETLRLHPPLPLLVPRESTQDVKINEYDIPKGTLVFINAWVVQRDPLTWDEPEEFRPERFLDSLIESKQHDFELFPFGGGRRICPGKSFAIANNELVLANLLHKFNWRLPDGVTPQTLDMSESVGVTLHRKTPLLAVPTPRIY